LGLDRVQFSLDGASFVDIVACLLDGVRVSCDSSAIHAYIGRSKFRCR
jgi:hypothetical protein